jgi:hypothetical protein
MITEDYVSFETAKLLKDKGFDWDWSPFYSEQDKDEWNKNNNYNIPNPNYDATIPFDSETLNVVAPHVSLQMAMKWLREEHNLCIEPYRTACGYLYTISTIPYGSCKCNPKVGGDDEDSGQWTTYEGACESAINYCLTNLILN